MRGKGLAAVQARDLAEKRQPTCSVRGSKRGQEEPPEQAGQHPHRQQKAGPAAHPARAVERDSAARHVDVRVVAPTPTIP
jgi:hypothetical protein